MIGQWITETQAKKLATDARLRVASGASSQSARMNKEQITATVNAITELMSALRYKTADDKAAIYAGLNLHLICSPGPRTVTGKPKSGEHVRKGRVRGGPTPYPHIAP